ncbi:F0F1 ATP synthase subunit B' [Chamaesiphon sp. VAR_48_metabat_403]|uniref:F0F1 ATP synthase subunit B' n=1 Tax=Chamaesiphon sp. VAR_48_metabat_403 TaxID=2964700 RepID=UPI00286DB462|nr:F0F1 ATP synthase subunit B' [Chamaesiphon sp. VAR_48_metabat_403]
MNAIPQWTLWLATAAVEEVAEKGKLFDFDATLPLMAIQFVVLVLVLNKLFYTPLGKVLDDRDEYIRGGLGNAKARLAEAEALKNQYEKELAETRRESNTVIATAKAEAQKIAAGQIAETQQAAQVQREQAQQEIDKQKQSAFAALEPQVEALSHQILTKLLGAELVK